LDEPELEDLMVLLPALLQSLEVLGFVARHFNPADFDGVMAAVARPDDALRAARPRLSAWPDRLGDVRAALETASDRALAAFDGLRQAQGQADLLRPVFRALGQIPRAQEALYPLAGALAPVSRYFLEPGRRGDAALQARLAQAPARDEVGVVHLDNEPGSRGGFSAYAPEYYTPDQAWPLVVALHGGAGNGRSFLWSWLRDARSHGAIVIAPTAVGDTWALSGPDRDTPNLARIVDLARARWNIDPARVLLTGMSDGGTFAYVTGLEPGSPFTHLAPIAAAFHPMLAQMADPARIGGLPIHVAHGALDWMFPVDMAREAARALAAAGAQVTYRELADLSHSSPRELNPEILDWMGRTGQGG
jgi:phospholipase/carboxylesterase